MWWRRRRKRIEAGEEREECVGEFFTDVVRMPSRARW